MDKKRSGWALIGVLFGSLTLALGLYIGAYLKLVLPTGAFAIQSEEEVAAGNPARGIVDPIYLDVPAVLDAWSFFEPIHCIDRKLRPNLWYENPRRTDSPHWF
jgi:hypothetical protein